MSVAKFSAELTDFKIVHNVLKSVLFKEYAVMTPMTQGLKITLDEMKSVETSVYIPVNVFTSYHVDSDDIKFKINIKIFAECLSLFEEDVNRYLKLTFRGEGSPLYMILKHSEENSTIDCQLSTIETENIRELSLSDECNLNKVVLEADGLLDILSVLDNNADELQITINNKAPYLQFSSSGNLGNSVVDISKESEIMAIFQCTQRTEFQYAFQNIRQILKVMQYATKVSISTCESGLLGLQLVVNSGDRKLYVEYYVTSLYDDR